MNDQDIYGGIFGSGVGLSLAPKSNVSGATFSGDGVTKTFTFSNNEPIVSSNPNSYDVIIYGVGQVPVNDYTVDVASNSITFVEAPPSGTGNVYVRIIAQAVSETEAAAVSINGYLTANPVATPVPRLAGIGGPINEPIQALLNNLALVSGAVQVASYEGLRAYTGPASTVQVTGFLVTSKPSGIFGTFVLDLSDTTSVDDGGAILVDTLGRRWKRQIGDYLSLTWYLPENYDYLTMSCLSAATRMWASAKALRKNAYHPKGRYRIIGEDSFPYGRVDGSTPTALTNYNAIHIYGDGQDTVLETSSISGADIIQLNGPDNIKVHDLALQSYITGTASGSNGISVTGGFDRVEIYNIWGTALAFVDKGTYIDGGKCLSIQTPVSGQTVKCGTLRAWNIYADGCVYGAGVELDLVAASSMATNIDIEITATRCREGFVMSAGEASAAIPADWQSSVNVKLTAINCMRDVNMSRAFGANVDCTVITTLTDAARILSPTGGKWKATDTIADVEAAQVAGCRHSFVNLSGHKGSCQYKARVGGAPAGSSGLTGATQHCKVVSNLSGTSAVEDFGAIDSGGNVSRDCVFMVYGDMGAPNIAHYLPSLNNTIVFGNVSLIKDLIVQGKLIFPGPNGKDPRAQVGYDGEAVTFKQTSGSSGDLLIARALRTGGGVEDTTAFAIRNDGGIEAVVNSASAVGAINGMLSVYNASTGAFYGYVPVHATYTP